MGTPNWTVQHEFDNEPTYVVDTANDPDGNFAVEFPANILPVEKRVMLAKQLAHLMNTEKVCVEQIIEADFYKSDNNLDR